MLLVNPHALLREALGGALRRAPGIGSLEEAGSLAAARETLVHVDAVVTSLILPDGDGVELVRAAAGARPRKRVIVVAMTRDRAWLERARSAGAAAVRTTDISIDELVRLLVGSAAEAARGSPPQNEPVGRLTERERQVLQCLAHGLTGPQTAQVLSISDSTVRRHMENIRQRLDVRSQAQAIAVATRMRLIELE